MRGTYAGTRIDCRRGGWEKGGRRKSRRRGAREEEVEEGKKKREAEKKERGCCVVEDRKQETQKYADSPPLSLPTAGEKKSERLVTFPPRSVSVSVSYMGVGRETVARPTLSLFIRLTSQHIPSRTESSSMKKDHHINVGETTARRRGYKVPDRGYIRGGFCSCFPALCFFRPHNNNLSPTTRSPPFRWCVRSKLNGLASKHFLPRNNWIGYWRRAIHVRFPATAFSVTWELRIFCSGTPAKRCM